MARRAVDLPRLVERSIDRALAGRSKLTPDVLSLSGLSSGTVRHLLNNLCDFPSANYLEIGTWTGSTLISASYRNSGRFTTIDNFSLSPPTREVFRRVLDRFKDSCRVTCHDADCWSPSLLRKLPRNVNVYCYDGPHGYEDQYRAFARYDSILASEFVTVVDDWNWWPVRKATRDAFAFLEHRVLFEREFLTTRFLKEQWWNGIFIAVVRKKRRRTAVRGAAKAGNPRPRTAHR